MDHLTDKAFYIVLKKEKKEKKTIIRFLRNVYEEKKITESTMILISSYFVD